MNAHSLHASQQIQPNMVEADFIRPTALGCKSKTATSDCAQVNGEAEVLSSILLRLVRKVSRPGSSDAYSIATLPLLQGMTSVLLMETTKERQSHRTTLIPTVTHSLQAHLA